MKRKPAVAGMFYPSDPQELRKLMKRLIPPHADKEPGVCAISPHAGFMYSGMVAGAVFASVSLPESCVLIGPSHRHHGSRFQVMGRGSWETPLGDASIDTELAGLLLEASPLVIEGSSTHIHEHSLEVQLPFLLYFQKNIKIVPISTVFDADYDELQGLGAAIARVIRQCGRNVFIVASTDMSHYVSAEMARVKDSMAIDRILDLDPRGLYDIVRSEDISMCGSHAVTAALCAAKNLGAQRAELIKYQHSGLVSGDNREVVGYAGIKIT